MRAITRRLDHAEEENAALKATLATVLELGQGSGLSAPQRAAMRQRQEAMRLGTVHKPPSEMGAAGGGVGGVLAAAKKVVAGADVIAAAELVDPAAITHLPAIPQLRPYARPDSEARRRSSTGSLSARW